MDYRGTLAVDKSVPVGFTDIRLSFELHTDADTEQLPKVQRLTEHHCVVL